MFYYFSLYSKISEYLETSFNVRIRHLPYTKCKFSIFAYGANSKKKIIEYFCQYPLIGKVSLDYELWREIFLIRSLEENSTQFKASLSSLKIHKKNLFTAHEVCKNFNFYLPSLELSNRRNFCTNYKLLFKPSYYFFNII